MKNFIKIDCSEIKLGMRFSSPVFFDDGKNMFLAEGRTVKPYHVAALKRWSIPFLLTYGHEVNNIGVVPAKKGMFYSSNGKIEDNVEDLEPIEEAEPVD